jgi:hypothetical protein
VPSRGLAASALRLEADDGPRRVRHLVALEAHPGGTTERVHVGRNGSVGRIQRYYDSATWPFTSGVACSLAAGVVHDRRERPALRLAEGPAAQPGGARRPEPRRVPSRRRVRPVAGARPARAVRAASARVLFEPLEEGRLARRRQRLPGGSFGAAGGAGGAPRRGRDRARRLGGGPGGDRARRQGRAPAPWSRSACWAPTRSWLRI